MSKSRLTTDVFYYEIEVFRKLHKKHGIYNIIFCKWDPIKDDEFIHELEEKWILVFSYHNRKNIAEQVIKLKEKYDILYINTTSELLINLSNYLKKQIGQKTCDNTKMFRNKFIQRELLHKWGCTNGIKFVKGSVKQLNFKTLEKKVGLPCILKPVNGIQSAGVIKINNKEDFSAYKYHFTEFHENCHNRWFESDLIIAEEYIDWEMFSLDYFVSEDGEISIARPVHVELGVELWIDDYFNGIMHHSIAVEEKFEDKEIEEFVHETVKACGIKNTFIHHEFKKTTKGKLKTIEINGRIWGGRVELTNEAYGINLYEFILGKKQARKKLKNNIIKINIYAPFKGTLTWFNEELIQRVKYRPSVYEIEQPQNFIGKKVGLTKDGFIKVITIKLKSENLDEIHRDMKYIKRNYKNFLYIEEESKFISIMNVVKTFTYTITPKRSKK